MSHDDLLTHEEISFMLNVVELYCGLGSFIDGAGRSGCLGGSGAAVESDSEGLNPKPCLGWGRVLGFSRRRVRPGSRAGLRELRVRNRKRRRLRRDC